MQDFNPATDPITNDEQAKAYLQHKFPAHATSTRAIEYFMILRSEQGGFPLVQAVSTVCQRIIREATEQNQMDIHQIRAQEKAVIEPGPQWEQGAYRIHSYYDGDSIAITAGGLLKIATWIEEHRAELEHQAQTVEEQRWQ